MRGRDLRRLTRALSARNVTSTWADLLTSVYMAILTLVLTVATVWWSARELLADRPATTPRLLLDPSWLAVLAALWFLALLVAVVSRVGPVALPRPEASWWLPIPVERRTLLRPAGATWLAVTAVVAAAAGVTLAGGLGAGMPTVALAGLAGAGIGALAVGVLALGQAAGRRREAWWADIPVLGVAVVGVLVVAVGLPPLPTPSPGPTAALAVAAVVAGAVVCWRADRRLERIHDVDLHRLGAAQELAQFATLQLDSRELGRALERAPRRHRRARSARLSQVRGPASALLVADAVALVRSPRHLAQLLIGLVIASLGAALRDWHTLLVIPLVFVGTLLAASATAEGARAAHRTPALDRLLPLGARATRWVRFAVPVVATALVTLALGALLGWRLGDVPGWVALVVAGTPVWAASVVRGAYRPDPQLSGLLIPTPIGAVPAGMGRQFVVGPDLAVVGMIPLWIALVAQQVALPLILVQAGLAVLALLVASRRPRRRREQSAPRQRS